MARLGGVPQNHVLNAMPPPDITRFLRRKRRSFASLMSYRWLLSPSRESWWQSPPAARLSRSIGRKNHDFRSADIASRTERSRGVERPTNAQPVSKARV